MNDKQHELLVRIDERVAGITKRLDELPCEIGSEKYIELEKKQTMIIERVDTLTRFFWFGITTSITSAIGAVFIFLKK
jgi:hypothetical protein